MNNISNNSKFIDALGQLPQFVSDTNADIDMAYDFVAEIANVDSFVADTNAWNLFWDSYNAALDSWEKDMTNNPYVNTLIEMGYDETDVKVASTMFQKKEFPLTMYGRTYNTEEEYHEAIHEFMNGMWTIKLHSHHLLCWLKLLKSVKGWIQSV